MHYSVPPYSQYIDVHHPQWKSRSCGIVSFQMVKDHYFPPKPTLPLSDSILRHIREAKHHGAYIPGIGWSHKGIVRLASRHGLSGKNYDWADHPPASALQTLLRHLQSGPVIASIHKNLDPRNGGHLVVVTGSTRTHIDYHDPDTRIRKDIPRSVPRAQFLRGWKQRAIVLHPKKLPKSSQIVNV